MEGKAASSAREPANLDSATWSAATDWTVGMLLSLVAIIIWVAFNWAIGWDLDAVGILAGMGAQLAYQRWRAARLARGLHQLDTAFTSGVVLAEVTREKNSPFRLVGSGQTSTLRIDDGQVILTGTPSFPPVSWPASAVCLGPGPSWWTARGISLDTPDGRHQFTLVPRLDPAQSCGAVVDRRALPAIEAALSAQRLVQPAAPLTVGPGWFPDPAGAPSMRWWDGTSWTDHLH